MRKIFVLLLLTGFPCFSQNYAVDQIKPELLKDADAVIRDYNLQVEVEDIDEMTVKTTRVITVMNKDGNAFVDPYETYREGVKISDQEMLVFNGNGEEIDKYKKRDFKDVSSYDSYVLFSDDRVSYLDFTPRQYPYTVKYTSEVKYDFTVFVYPWYPLPGYGVSVEHSAYTFQNESGIEHRFIERNFEGFSIKKENTATSLHYEVDDLPAVLHENLSPDFDKIYPVVRVALNHFELHGVEGSASNWKEFGKWMYDNLVAGHDELSQETVQKMTALTAGASSVKEKIEKIYDFVQNNTRYVNVSYGIGGWEPAYARDVDELGYGDCKGLTNYTKALLESQGIKSYYTVVHAKNKRDIDPEFASMQGNHVILNIPQEGASDIWLECTSQDIPFNYLGDFTDDRYVLRVGPEGGEIIRTRNYTAEENLEKIDCEIQLEEDGSFSADFKRENFGLPYQDISWVEKSTPDKQKEYYRDQWSDLQNIDFGKIEFHNDKKKIEFDEDLQFKGTGLATRAGNRLLIPLNFVEQGAISLGNSKDRSQPVILKRGKTYSDDFIFILPEKFDIEALPESQKLTSEFGEFSIEINTENAEDSRIIVKRKLILNEGEWAADKYSEFLAFIGGINQLNNLKAVIVSTNKT